jgi:hypothetical protein
MTFLKHLVGEMQRVYQAFRGSGHAAVDYQNMATPNDVLGGIMVALQILIGDCIAVSSQILNTPSRLKTSIGISCLRHLGSKLVSYKRYLVFKAAAYTARCLSALPALFTLGSAGE